MLQQQTIDGGLKLNHIAVFHCKTVLLLVSVGIMLTARLLKSTTRIFCSLLYGPTSAEAKPKHTRYTPKYAKRGTQQKQLPAVVALYYSYAIARLTAHVSVCLTVGHTLVMRQN